MKWGSVTERATESERERRSLVSLNGLSPHFREERRRRRRQPNYWRVQRTRNIEFCDWISFTGPGRKACRFCSATARQGQTEQLRRSRKKFLATTYKPFFPSLYCFANSQCTVLKLYEALSDSVVTVPSHGSRINRYPL